ncbi:MAG: alpha/beta hydrolase [Clostridia bacterium]|nr:alpha/beta hydrolase [Clostridia bacterium]
MREKEFKGADGKIIFYRLWECENPKGMVQIVHGMAENSLRYEKIAEHLVEQGFLVFADDHRGHGKTDDCLGYSDGDMFFDTLKDVAILSDIYKNLYPKLPLIILGHSYGSFLTQAYLERYGDKIDGAIIGGSAMMKGALITAGGFISSLGCLFGKKKKPAKLLANMSFGSYNKKFSEGTFISSINKECEIYAKAWGCGFTLSYNFYKYFFKGLKTLYIKKNYKNVPTDKPILLIAGRQDPVGDMGVSVKKLEKFYLETVGVKSLETVLYDGVRHEYFNDTSRDASFEKVSEFCNKIVEG